MVDMDLFKRVMKDAETKVVTVRRIKDRGIDEFHEGDKTRFVTFEFFEATIKDLCMDIS